LRQAVFVSHAHAEVLDEHFRGTINYVATQPRQFSSNARDKEQAGAFSFASLKLGSEFVRESRVLIDVYIQQSLQFLSFKVRDTTCLRDTSIDDDQADVEIFHLAHDVVIEGHLVALGEVSNNDFQLDTKLGYVALCHGL